MVETAPLTTLQRAQKKCDASVKILASLSSWSTSSVVVDSPDSGNASRYVFANNSCSGKNLIFQLVLIGRNAYLLFQSWIVRPIESEEGRTGAGVVVDPFAHVVGQIKAAVVVGAVLKVDHHHLLVLLPQQNVAFLKIIVAKHHRRINVF
jgi:hypothetical protein